MNNNSSNPHVESCLKEVLSVIKRYDLGGYVVLSDGSNTAQCGVALEPSFSNLKFLNDLGDVEIALDSEETRALMERTIKMIFGVHHLCKAGIGMTDEILKAIEKRMEISRFSDEGSSE